MSRIAGKDMENLAREIEHYTISAITLKIAVQARHSQREAWVARIYRDAKTVQTEDIKNLPKSGWMPVGSVAFCRTAMMHQGIHPDLVSTYPESLHAFMHRHIWMGTALQVRVSDQRFFVKPRDHKVFNGFIWQDGDFDQHQFMAEPDALPVWCSDVVSFASEWRYYVLNGVIVGAGRYGEGPDDAPMPDLKVVEKMMHAFQPDAPAGYGLDVGVLDTGETALIEVNDGWGSLGLYKGTCTSRDYLRLLEARWIEIGQASKC
jgi:hypothetical protein